MSVQSPILCKKTTLSYNQTNQASNYQKQMSGEKA